MKTKLVKIGNSRGVRIPKPLIEECGLGDKVDLHVESGRLVISASRRPREGWQEAFRAAGTADEELLLEGTRTTEFDEKEWRW